MGCKVFSTWLMLQHVDVTDSHDNSLLEGGSFRSSWMLPSLRCLSHAIWLVEEFGTVDA